MKRRRRLPDAEPKWELGLDSKPLSCCGTQNGAPWGRAKLKFLTNKKQKPNKGGGDEKSEVKKAQVGNWNKKGEDRTRVKEGR